MRFILILAVAARALASPSLIQVNSTFVGQPGCGASSCSVAFPGFNTPGCLIVVSINADDGSGVVVSDSQGNTYKQDIVQSTIWSGWHAPNIHAGPNSITATQTGTTYLAIGIAEFCITSPLITIDKVSGRTQPGVTSYDSGSATTVQNGELIVGYGTFTSGASTIYVGGGFLLLANINGDIWEYQIQSTAGNIAATFNTDTPVDGLAFMQTFYEPPANHHSGGTF